MKWAGNVVYMRHEMHIKF